MVDNEEFSHNDHHDAAAAAALKLLSLLRWADTKYGGHRCKYRSLQCDNK